MPLAGFSGCGSGFGVGAGVGVGAGAGFVPGPGVTAASPVNFKPYSAKPSSFVPMNDIAGLASTSALASGEDANTTSRSFSAAAVTLAEGLIGASDQLPSAAGLIVLLSRI
ncbi:hypothetical protein D3C76_1660150 [compost metagenome]